MNEASSEVIRVGSKVAGTHARESYHADRLIIALLCIVGVLAWLFTMHSMSHPQLDAVAGVSAHGHSISAPVAHDGAPAALGADTGVPVANPTAAWSSGGQFGGDMTCAVLGIGCMLALLVLIVRLLLVRPTVSRTHHVSAASRIIRAGRQRIPSPPSLIALSISRT